MQQDITSTEPSGRRYRHRSRRRKAVESVGLVIGVPILLAVVLGLSVELIEYRPDDGSASQYAKQTAPVVQRSSAPSQRMPAVVAENPQITIDAEPTRP